MRISWELVSGSSSSHPSFAALAGRLTESTQRAMHFARQEALSRGDSEFTVADLLAGLTHEEDTRAQRVGHLKRNAFYLRWLAGLPALPDRHPGLAGQAASSAVVPDGETRRALAFAVLEADRDRDYWIDSDHLLRGLLRFPNKACFALLKTEINLKSARDASREDRDRFPPDRNPSLKVMQYLVRKYVALLAPPALSLACYLYILLEEFGAAANPLAH